MLPASLVVVEGPNRGASYTLAPASTGRIGRDPSCEVHLPDERASRVHAEVRPAGEGLLLVDLESANGTWLNGVRVTRSPLQPGDEVRLGDTTLLFVSAQQPSGDASGRSTMVLQLAPQAGGSAPAQVAVPEPAIQLLGRSPALLELERRIARAAGSQAPVLLHGESGTGKELVARAIHRTSPRRRGPFLAVNGALLRGELVDSELFGHEKGAFTGAAARRKGAFELAAGGTLFLDEVGELPLATQAALLRVVEGQGLRRVGGSELLGADVRLIAATHRDLAAQVAAGAFRQDLLFRLDVARIELPPLRERVGDVRLLAEQFLRELGRGRAGGPRRFAPEALAALEGYPWPGNVRELRNVVERAVIFGEGEEVALADLPAGVRGALGPDPPVDAAGRGPGAFPSLREVEAAHVARALRETGWNKTRAAALLGIDRVTLYAKIEKYGLSP